MILTTHPLCHLRPRGQCNRLHQAESLRSLAWDVDQKIDERHFLCHTVIGNCSACIGLVSQVFFLLRLCHLFEYRKHFFLDFWGFIGEWEAETDAKLFVIFLQYIPLRAFAGMSWAMAHCVTAKSATSQSWDLSMSDNVDWFFFPLPLGPAGVDAITFLAAFVFTIAPGFFGWVHV